MAIMKATDLLQKMIDEQWKEHFEPIVRVVNSNGGTKLKMDRTIEGLEWISESLLGAPLFKDQLKKAGFDVYLSQEEVIKAISWKNAMPNVDGKEIYPDDEEDECEQEDEEAVYLESGSSESRQETGVADCS